MKLLRMYASLLALLLVLGYGRNAAALEPSCMNNAMVDPPRPSTAEQLKVLGAFTACDADYESRILDGRLARLYGKLVAWRAWVRSLEALPVDSTALAKASKNVDALLAAIEDFTVRYVSDGNRVFIGDASVTATPDVIVILGSDPIRMQQRINRALPIIRASTVPIIVSGGGRSTIIEANVMRDRLLAEGIVPTRIRTEEESMDTVGNALFTSILVHRSMRKPLNILVVTSEFHGPRSLYLFRQVFGPTAHVGVALASSAIGGVPPPKDRMHAAVVSELTQQATAINTIFSTDPSLNGDSLKPVASDDCTILIQLMTHHELYKNRWDLARKHADVCSG